jgi:hypothetical protein
MLNQDTITQQLLEAQRELAALRREYEVAVEERRTRR